MNRTPRCTQAGMTLIEVLVSLLVLAIGLLGAAAIQINALKYTDSSTMASQASFIAYDMLDRIRANVDGNATENGSANVLATYALASLSAAPTSGTSARDQDLMDFKRNIEAFAGTTAGANSRILIDRPVVTITIVWDETRADSAAALAAGQAPATTNQGSFVLSSRVGVNP